jgi:hypothetical protein
MGARNTGCLRDGDTFEGFNGGVSIAAVFLVYRKLQMEYRTYQWPVSSRGACATEKSIPRTLFFSIRTTTLLIGSCHPRRSASIYAWTAGIDGWALLLEHAIFLMATCKQVSKDWRPNRCSEQRYAC